jgi:hypothetical protein
MCLTHDDHITSENGVLFLRCALCGRRTPGWNVRGTAEGTADQHSMKKYPAKPVRVVKPAHS